MSWRHPESRRRLERRQRRLSARQVDALQALASATGAAPAWLLLRRCAVHPSTLHALCRLELAERRTGPAGCEGRLTPAGVRLAGSRPSPVGTPALEGMTPAQRRLRERLQRSGGAWLPCDPRTAQVLARRGEVEVRQRTAEAIAQRGPRRWTVEVRLPSSAGPGPGLLSIAGGRARWIPTGAELVAARPQVHPTGSSRRNPSTNPARSRFGHNLPAGASPDDCAPLGDQSPDWSQPRNQPAPGERNRSGYAPAPRSR